MMRNNSMNALEKNGRASASPGFHMADAMELGAPVLRVKDMSKVLAFYTDDIGLKVKTRYMDSDNLEIVELGSSSKAFILLLKHDPNANLSPPNSAGLYHYAVLVPDRKSLASTFLAIGNSGILYEGFADHLVSEALYLHDVEQNGIEIYADRPRGDWPNWKEISERAQKTGDYGTVMSVMGKPLDFNSLLCELSKDESGNPKSFQNGAKIGHLHLRVTDLARSAKFYQEKIGLDIMMNLPNMSAAFLSAGGYHHHIGLNTWHSLDGPERANGSAGLEGFMIKVPDLKALESMATQFPGSYDQKTKQLRVRDPDNLEIIIESA